MYDELRKGFRTVSRLTPLVEESYQNQEIYWPWTRNGSNNPQGFSATPIYYRINEFLYTQLETDYFCESMTRAEMAYMKRVSLQIHSGFTGTSYRLRRLERLLSSLPALECLKMTISLESRRIYSAHGQEPEKGNCMAIAVDLENSLPTPTSEEKKWIRRWVVDTKSFHFWYVPKEFKMTRWVSFVFHLASRAIADARPRT
jgi:hypothetical protein